MQTPQDIDKLLWGQKSTTSQTTEEKMNIIRLWLQYKKPADLLDTEHNGNVLWNHLEGNNIPWTFGNLDAAVKTLGDNATGGKLQFNPKPKTVYVEVEKKPTPQEIERARIREAQSLGFQGVRNFTTEFDRIEKENPKPTEAELVVNAMRDLRNNAFLQETNGTIENHRGATHGATAKQRDALLAERDRLIRAKASPEQILNGIRSKRDSFSDTSITSRVHGVKR